MGSINESWHSQLLLVLQNLKISAELKAYDGYHLVSLNEGTAVLNLMDLKNTKLPQELISLQEAYLQKNSQLIHLWEDVWQTRKEQVLGRIKALVGLNARVYARKTDVIVLSQLEADTFLDANHLQSSVGLKFRYGLVWNDQLVAVAGFSGLRKMHNGLDNYRSAELIRFANLLGTTVIGGFTKLLSHFIKLHQPNDVMSYADRDWSLGRTYEKSEFSLVETTPPALILVDKNTFIRTFPHRLNNEASENQYLKVFNSGNLKYILDCEY